MVEGHVPKRVRVFESRPPQFLKMENPQRQALVTELKKASSINDAPIWKRIALDLEKPVNRRRVVNLSKIDQFSEDNDVVVVPGKVLSMGDLTKKVTIAAYSFSGSSLEKIKIAGSKAITINELCRKNPKGSKIKIIG